MKNQRPRSRFVLCVRNAEADDLELRKVYQVLPDRDVGEDYVRVIDESGEDYLYPAEYFVPLKLPLAVARELHSPRTNARHRSGKVPSRAASRTPR